MLLAVSCGTSNNCFDHRVINTQVQQYSSYDILDWEHEVTNRNPLTVRFNLTIPNDDPVTKYELFDGDDEPIQIDSFRQRNNVLFAYLEPDLLDDIGIGFKAYFSQCGLVAVVE